VPEARAAETPKVADPVKVAETPPVPAAVSNEDFWKALVESVRRERKLISGWLEAGALIRVDGPAVQIGFPPDQAFSKDFLEQGHRDFLAAAAGAILGRKVNLSLEIRDGIVANPLPQPPPEPKLDPMEAFKRDPLIRKALEIFRAEVQPA
jgi:DNA polymerase-3 subunit gamma/tau